MRNIVKYVKKTFSYEFRIEQIFQFFYSQFLIVYSQLIKLLNSSNVAVIE